MFAELKLLYTVKNISMNCISVKDMLWKTFVQIHHSIDIKKNSNQMGTFHSTVMYTCTQHIV